MTTLRVLLDELAASPYGGMARYARELTRALIATAPPAEVEALVPASPEPDYARILDELPGLARLEKSALERRELAAAWRRGLGRTGRTGMLHAMSPLAPLGARDRLHHPGDQVVVTLHDAIAWSHPELLERRQVSWTRAMAKRAERHADAVVVPSHAVAEELGAHLDLGDRLRIIPGAPSAGLAPLRTDPDPELPGRYLLTVAGAEPKKGLDTTLAALTLTADPWPLVLVTDDPAAAAARVTESGLDPSRVTIRGQLDDPELGALYFGAAAYLQSSVAEGFGLSVLEALAFGLPVVHTDIPALSELTAGASIAVPAEPDGLADRFAEAIDAIDGVLAERLSIAAGDRSRAFSWRDSAEKVWQLHADL